MSDDSYENEVGDLGDAYLLLGELGRGASAIVYRAQDRSLLREVAIKVVRPRLSESGEEALARLAREARTVARLQHPNIVTVHAVKRLRDGGLALVMQLIPGRTLKQALAEDGAFTPARAERVVKDIAEALAYAHAHGVVHRDVKPENIFLDSESGRALLSDFGIAHSTEFDSRLTMDGAAIGTPAYMAPEQIDGSSANARSDLYSLGLVAWELLTGERPWEGEALYNVIFKQKYEDLPAIDALRPGVVPPRLQYIVERMMQKRPSARWAGADGLLAALNNWVLPGDWKQWEESHRRRREALKTKPRARSAVTDGASAATVRFVRPADGPAIVAALNGEIAPPTAPAAVTTAAFDDEAPSWATTAHAPSRWRRWAGVSGLVLLVAGGAAATYAQRQGYFGTRATHTSTLTDSRAVELPVVTPRTSDTTVKAPDATSSSTIGGAAANATSSVSGGAAVGAGVGAGVGAPNSAAAPNAAARPEPLNADSVRADSIRADSIARRKVARAQRATDSIRADSFVAASLRRATAAAATSPTPAVVLTVNGTQQMATQATGRTVIYGSNAPNVATVSSTGLVTAIAPGTARISATSDGKVGTVTIMVIAERVASVFMTPTTASLNIGDTQLLTTTARSAAGALLNGRPITWQSGAPGVATVSSSGLVTAVSPGVVVILTTVEGVTATAMITVNAPPLR